MKRGLKITLRNIALGLYFVLMEVVIGRSMFRDINRPSNVSADHQLGRLAEPVGGAVAMFLIAIIFWIIWHIIVKRSIRKLEYDKKYYDINLFLLFIPWILLVGSFIWGLITG